MTDAQITGDQLTGAKIKLPARLCIDTIEQVYEDLNKVSLESGEVLIDIDDIERVDFCGLQLLLAFTARLSFDSVVPKWVGENAVLSQAIADAQLKDALGG